MIDDLSTTKREEVMKRLRTVLGGVLMFGLLAMIPMGCSDSDSGSSPVPPSVPTNRIYILSAMGDATLLPAVEANASGNGQSWEYTLTLEDVTENVFWFSDKPERDSGNETAEYFLKPYGRKSMLKSRRTLFWKERYRMRAWATACSLSFGIRCMIRRQTKLPLMLRSKIPP